MAQVVVSADIDALLRTANDAAARTELGLGDAATKNTGTTAGTVAAGDDSRITGAVQTTRTITAGTGLTGGGDLSANRTLAVSYGTTAGTAAQGNDARLSDARTPTTHAATHAAAGSDPITITAAQISGSLTQNTTGTANNVTGTVAAANGGTGQTTYTNGQLLIGNASGGLTKATLTAGTNVTITNGNGSITIDATAGAGGVSSFSAGTTGLTPSTGTTGAVTLAGTLNVANGGTGATTLTGIVKGSGTSPLSVAVAGTDYVAPNGNITGTAGNVTGTVAIANGGTGQTTAANAINALVPSQSGQSGKVLTTNGSVVSWGTAGGSGITALTGDVTASGSGSVSATVQKIQSRTVASTAPSAGQVLAWNDTTSQWEPTSAGGAVSYDVLRVLIATPGFGTYVVPSGYKYADIYACSGGGGGGSGMNTSGNASGGGGGSHGVFCYREKVYVENTQLTYTIGAGGAGGTQDLSTGNANPGTAGGGTVVQFAVPPPGGSASAVIADCGYYVNSGALSSSWGSAASPSGATGGFINFSQFWLQNTQSGGVATASGTGSQPANSTIYTQATYVSSGGGGGGVSNTIAPNVFDGGNILDNNYVLYSSATPLNYAGIAGSSSTIDATSVSGNPTLNIFWGGAGGAGADPSTAISSGGVFRAGNGANGAFGCGGGGGGSMYDLSGSFSTYTGGNGGNGGDGFILMYLYK